jgi:hypothetical protein
MRIHILLSVLLLLLGSVDTAFAAATPTPDDDVEDVADSDFLAGGRERKAFPRPREPWPAAAPGACPSRPPVRGNVEERRLAPFAPPPLYVLLSLRC